MTRDMYEVFDNAAHGDFSLLRRGSSRDDAPRSRVRGPLIEVREGYPAGVIAWQRYREIHKSSA